jgi:hypothetical protein
MDPVNVKKRKEKKKTLDNTIIKRKIYNHDNLVKALEAVKCGMSKKLAAKTFHVPRGTIQFRLRKVDHQDLPGPSTVLTKNEEETLVKWIKDCCRKGFPRRKLDVQLSVAHFIKKANRKNPFKDGIPGNKWYQLFLHRHPGLSIRAPEAVTASSAAVSEQDIRNWFIGIETYLKDNSYFTILSDPSRVFNGDESNFQLCPKSGKVIAMRGEKDVYEVDHASAKSALTVLFTFSANGDTTPPMIIFPNKRLPKDITLNVPGDWGIGLSDSGWMKAEVFYDYIKNVLHPYLLKTKRQLPVLLFVDGHKTHLSLEVSELCKSLDIFLVALYPNATRLMQPADVSAFRPLKQAWKESVLKWRRENPLAALTKTDFVPVLKEAVVNGIKPSTVINGFRTTGLCPWNCDAINFNKCLARQKTVENSNTEEKNNDNFKEKSLSKDTFYNIVGEKKLNALQTLTEDFLIDSDKILKKLLNYFQHDEKHQESEILHEDNLTEEITIEEMPILFMDILDNSQFDLVTVQKSIEEMGKNKFERKEHKTLLESDLVTLDKNEMEIPESDLIATCKEHVVKECEIMDIISQQKEYLTPVKLSDVLVKPKTPQRKGVKQSERVSFVLTSDEWQSKETQKRREKSLKEEQVKKRKEERIQKQKEVKTKQGEKKNLTKKTAATLINKQSKKVQFGPVQNTTKRECQVEREPNVKKENMIPETKRIKVLADIRLNKPLVPIVNQQVSNPIVDEDKKNDGIRDPFDKILSSRKKSYTLEELEAILNDDD